MSFWSNKRWGDAVETAVLVGLRTIGYIDAERINSGPWDIIIPGLMLLDVKAINVATGNASVSEESLGRMPGSADSRGISDFRLASVRYGSIVWCSVETAWTGHQIRKGPDLIRLIDPHMWTPFA